MGYQRANQCKASEEISRKSGLASSHSVSLNPSPSSQDTHLQQTFGNRAVQRLLKSRAIQAKLTVSEPGDFHEQEADRVASQVVQQQKTLSANRGGAQMTSSEPVLLQRTLQRTATSFPEDAEEELKIGRQVQRKGDAPVEADDQLQERLDALAGSGQAMPQGVKREMEASFGASFDRVRIHTDGEAARISRSLHAEAFTYGNDIFFGAGKYEDTTEGGRGLLAHELTHTLQQTGIHLKAIQRRGGATVGQLSINSNVVNAGLTAGHAWLAYTPNAGPMTTYGTWGNRVPIGLHRDIELGYAAAATRTTALDAVDYTALTTFAAANNSWGYINNCASFAARGWQTVTGEALSYTSYGIPNPSALGAGIVAANGGAVGVLAAAPAPAGGSSTGSW
ncbi:MAG: DUF4157 domain-containing protein [Candidatus Manganitrophaceae bacterium]